MAHKENCIAWDEPEPAGGCPACGGTAPTQTAVTPEERAHKLQIELSACDGRCDYCGDEESAGYGVCRPDIVKIAAAIRDAVNEKIEQAQEHLRFTAMAIRGANGGMTHASLAYDAAANEIEPFKLPSPEKPEKEVVGGRESKPARSDTDATKEWTRPTTCGMPCSCEDCKWLSDCVAKGRVQRTEKEGT